MSTNQPWVLQHLSVTYPIEALAAEQLQPFIEFPPRQKPAAFNFDTVLEHMNDAPGSGLQ